MKKRRQNDGLGLLELAELALHQVRAAPVLAPYYIGSLPFVLAFLYFWADMIQGAFAYRHVDTSALGVAVAFVWMKCWQAVACARMRANLSGGSMGTWDVPRVVRLVSTQTIIHASAFFVLPMAMLVMIPFGHAYAFYQNATVFGADEDNGVAAVAKRAWTEARRWPKQNHLIIWMFSPLPLVLAAGVLLVMLPVSEALSPDWNDEFVGIYLTFFTIFLVPLSPIGVLTAFNVGMAIALGPYLLNSLLGIELAVTMRDSFVDATFMAVCVGVASLCLDPVLKAAYTLRCFHGESLSTGEDLRIALRRAAARGLRAGVLIAMALAAVAAAPGAASAQDAPARPVVEAGELDRAIAAELEKTEYVWRMPKEVPGDAFQDNFITLFVRSVREVIGEFLRNTVGRLIDWLGDVLSNISAGGGPASQGGGWMSTQRALWFLVFGALLVALGVVVYRIYKQRAAGTVPVVAHPVVVTPDLEDEDVLADALPEEGWLDLARDLIGRGDLRLAMRALFLASLAVLSHRDLLRIGKAKSNREYLRELERRAHAVPAMPPLFAAGIGAFERVWYGDHAADAATFREFEAAQEKIRALAKQQ